MGAVETKVFQKVPPWEAAFAAQNTLLEKEVVQLLWRKWRNDSRSEDGKVDFKEFLTLADTIRRQWERWGDSDSESEAEDEVVQDNQHHPASTGNNEEINSGGETVKPKDEMKQSGPAENLVLSDEGPAIDPEERTAIEESEDPE